MDQAQAQKEAKEKVDILAALVGATSSEMKTMDDMIISSSTNLQRSADAWNPEGILRQEITAQQHNVPAGAPPPSQGAVASPPPMQMPPGDYLAPAPPAPAPVQVQTVTVDNSEQLNRIESKLDKFLSEIDRLTTLDNKLNSFVDRGLKDKVKQITLKLHDSPGK